LDGGGDANPGALPSFKVAHSEDFAPKDDPFANAILPAAVVDASSIIRRRVGLLIIVSGELCSFEEDVSAYPILFVVASSSSFRSAVTTLMRLRVDAHMEACLEREKTRGTEVHVVWASIVVGQIFRGRLFFNDF
jgi:hypothetical protein|tara:strand:+ start:1257 stop:1661 length:405 start_codon:yes stop_codon:yes gene_type:complete